MSDISFDNAIKSNTSENSINYVLEDESIFYEVGYKVLQNQEKNGLVKCGKLLQNGKIKLVYDVTRYKPLNIMLSQINRQNYLLIVARLYDVVKHIEENGFIRCENIEVSLEKIFIDNDDLSVHLICLPINHVSRFQNTQLCYESLKRLVLNATNIYSDLQAIDVQKVIDASRDGKNGVKEEIKPKEPVKAITYLNHDENDISEPEQIEKNKSKIKKTKKAWNLFSGKKSSKPVIVDTTNYITITSTNFNDVIRFVINKPIFVIGTQVGAVDGVISNEKTISRVHCKILEENKNYYIQDMGSLNGTYVNNIKMIEGQKVQINRGDIIKMSKIEFIVR